MVFKRLVDQVRLDWVPTARWLQQVILYGDASKVCVENQGRHNANDTELVKRTVVALATIRFHPHAHVTLPGQGQETQVPRLDHSTELMSNDRVRVHIPFKYLYHRKTYC